METRTVVCPESGAVERISCLVSRDGEPLLVLRCTAFEPSEAVMCTTPCIQCPHERAKSDPTADPWALPLPIAT